MPNVERQIERILEICERTHAIAEKSLTVSEQILSQLLPPAPPPAAYLVVRWTIQNQGETNMPVNLVPGQTAQGLWSPVDINGNPSKAVLSNPSFSTSDATVFSVAVDPANPTNGCIVTALTPAVVPDSAVVTANATATETSGVTENISGTDTVQVSAATPPPPPPPVAASLVVTWTPGPAPAAKK